MKVLLASLLIGAAATAFAQPSEVFEVASIKRSDAAINHTMFSYQPGGGIRIEGATLQNLVEFTYDLRDYQLSGATGWITSERYTILAKGLMTEGPVEYMKMNDQQRKTLAGLVRKRMQRLLAERFQLAAHNETRQLPGYALVTAKGGHNCARIPRRTAPRKTRCGVSRSSKESGSPPSTLHKRSPTLPGGRCATRRVSPATSISK